VDEHTYYVSCDNDFIALCLSPTFSDDIFLIFHTSIRKEGGWMEIREGGREGIPH
jgi:hypothetical protein